MPEIQRHRGGDYALRGHMSEESRELASKLNATRDPLTVLAPDPKTATGFKVLKLEGHHKWRGLMINEAPQREGSLPPESLLSELGGVGHRVGFIPQLFSKSAERNVRFYVSLPANFDPDKKYDVVGLTPDRPPGTTIAEALSNDRLANRLADIPGADGKIVVMLERLEHRSGAMSAKEHDELAEAILQSDLQPYLAEAFSASSKKLDLVPFTERKTDSSDRLEDKPSGLGDFSRADVESKGKKKKGKKGSGFSWAPRLSEALKKTTTGVVVAKRFDSDVVAAAKLDDEVLGKLGGLPSRSDLDKLKDVDRPVVMLAKSDAGPYAVIVPPNFDRGRDPSYEVATFIPPSTRSFTSVVQELATKGGAARDDTIVVVPMRNKGESVDACRERAELGMLAALRKADIRVNYSKYSTGTLARGDLRTAISDGPVTRRSLPAPIVSVDGKWYRFAPTANPLEKFPSAGSRAAGIPKTLQKQGPNHGTLFVSTIDSKALDGKVRMATYLPPGYDPDSKEKYPVLVMLPGRGNELSAWTSAGGLIQTLDATMQGDAQKMIVVIPDATDSLWFDYDKHGGDFGKRGKRDFEGHVFELIAHATGDLAGDPDRLSIHGMSYGGFGAMQLAARHPGKFASAGATAGLLDLQHGGGVLDKNAEGLVRRDHFKGADDPAWEKFNPPDLVANGAFKDGKTAIRLDVGKDAATLRHTLGFSDRLANAGISHDLIVASGKEELKHNWGAWAGMLGGAVTFAQSAHGKPGESKLGDGWTDIAKSALSEFRADKKARETQIAELRRDLPQMLLDLSDRAKALLPRLADARPYESLAGLGEELAKRVDGAKSLGDEIRTALDPQKVPLHAAEDRAPRLREHVDRFASLVREGEYGLRTRYLGEPIAKPKTDPAVLQKIHSDEAAALELIMEGIPETKAGLLQLATARPELFDGKPDRITGKRFGEHLLEFIRDEHLYKSELDGFAEFLDRLAVKRYDWRTPGYSHSVCSTMNTFYNHPGLILDLIGAARDDKGYKTHGVFSGDGDRRLKPMGDFQAGFRPVDWARGGKLPPARLGYERGLLRAVVDELSCSAYRLPPDRFASLCDPVAVGISKLTGEVVKYGYAFAMKTGEDIAKAVQSQGDEGLAMADVMVKIRGSEPFNLHFPVFYDYDPKTRTMAMQEWKRPEQRISVDDIEIVPTEKNPGAAIYYRESEDLKEFLTPWRQKNWEAIRPDRDEKKSSSKSDD